MKKLRWGVIGAGGIADRRTIPGMMLAENAELIAVMDINAEQVEKIRQKYGAKRGYTKEEDLLADPEVDAVYIATPIVLHAKQAKLAADYGKDILIEKPLAMTSDEGQAVIDYCEHKGVKIAAGFMMRFGSHVMSMKKAIAEGKILHETDIEKMLQKRRAAYQCRARKRAYKIARLEPAAVRLAYKRRYPAKHHAYQRPHCAHAIRRQYGFHHAPRAYKPHNTAYSKRQKVHKAGHKAFEQARNSVKRGAVHAHGNGQHAAACAGQHGRNAYRQPLYDPREETSSVLLHN